MQTVHVQQSVDIASPLKRVWDAFIEQPASWWGSPYLLLEGAGRVEFPIEAGSPVIERLDTGSLWRGTANALWGIVTIYEPLKTYGWNGQMGMGPSVTGEVRFEFEETEQGCRVKLAHDFTQLWGDNLARLGASYDYGWADLLARLRIFTEDGKRYGAKGENTTPDFSFIPSVR